jgi:hypothetical protein
MKLPQTATGRDMNIILVYINQMSPMWEETVT